MLKILRFIKLMKSEPVVKRKKRTAWVLDESKYLNLGEVKQLRTYSKTLKQLGLEKKRFSQVRNWFMIELGLYSGLRVDEMAQLKHCNFFIDGTESSIAVLGKGNKKRVVWINSDFKKIYKYYVKYKKMIGFNISGDSSVLNNLKGNKITKRALQKFFKIISKKAGLKSCYSIHCLRHTYATFILKTTNNDYRFLQDQLGHSSIKTTQIYAGIMENERKKDIENLYK
jgi:site-specific recombinase XerD